MGRLDCSSFIKCPNFFIFTLTTILFQEFINFQDDLTTDQLEYSQTCKVVFTDFFVCVVEGGGISRTDKEGI